MTYQTINKVALTPNEVDMNLPKELSSQFKWLVAIATALLLGVGTMLVSLLSLSLLSSNSNPVIRSEMSLNKGEDSIEGCGDFCYKGPFVRPQFLTKENCVSCDYMKGPTANYCLVTMTEDIVAITIITARSFLVVMVQ